MAMGFFALKNFHRLLQLSVAKPCALLLLEAMVSSAIETASSESKETGRLYGMKIRV